MDPAHLIFILGCGDTGIKLRHWILLAVVAFLLVMAYKDPVRHSAGHQAFLPVVIQGEWLVGAQDETKTLYKEFPEAGVYHINIRWDQAERVKNLYSFDQDTITAAAAASERGLILIIGTRASPEWARLRAWVCSQPKESNYADYGRFMIEIIDRFHPWGVELWNEPDVRFVDVVDWWYFMGCWDYPASYAAMVQEVVPMIRAAHPETKILVGALMLDRDWGFEFAEKVQGMGDFLSFHSYSYYGASDWNRPQNKVQQLRAMGIQDPLFMTETALLDKSGRCSQVFEAQKTAYAAYVAQNAGRWGLAGRLWYTAGQNGWECSDHTRESWRAWITGN